MYIIYIVLLSNHTKVKLNVLIFPGVPSKCQLGDKTCLDNIVNSIKPLIFGKIPGMGVESSDPLFIQEIVADISGFKYKLYNSTWIGYSKCVFSNMT